MMVTGAMKPDQSFASDMSDANLYVFAWAAGGCSKGNEIEWKFHN